MKKIKFKSYLIALIPFLILICLFELLPLASVVVKSFLSDAGTGFTLENYINVAVKPFYRQAIINSVVISVVSAAVGIFIAFIGAKAVHEKESTLKSVFMAILNMTSNFAGVPLAFAFIILLGKTGILVILAKTLGIESIANFDLYSNHGLMLIYIYFQIPLATLLLIPAFNALREEYKDAAKLLKANSFQYWIYVGLPILMPSFLSTFSVLFSNSLVAFATAYALLSGNASLLPIRISEMFVGDLTQRVGLGSALSVILLLLMALAFWINNSVTNKLRKDV